MARTKQEARPSTGGLVQRKMLTCWAVRRPTFMFGGVKKQPKTKAEKRQKRFQDAVRSIKHKLPPDHYRHRRALLEACEAAKLEEARCCAKHAWQRSGFGPQDVLLPGIVKAVCHGSSKGSSRRLFRAFPLGPAHVHGYAAALLAHGRIAPVAHPPPDARPACELVLWTIPEDEPDEAVMSGDGAESDDMVVEEAQTTPSSWASDDDLDALLRRASVVKADKQVRAVLPRVVSFLAGCSARRAIYKAAFNPEASHGGYDAPVWARGLDFRLVTATEFAGALERKGVRLLPERAAGGPQLLDTARFSSVNARAIRKARKGNTAEEVMSKDIDAIGTRLQDAVEALTVRVLEAAQLCAFHACRTALLSRDLQLVIRLMGFSWAAVLCSGDDTDAGRYAFDKA